MRNGTKNRRPTPWQDITPAKKPSTPVEPKGATRKTAALLYRPIKPIINTIKKMPPKKLVFMIVVCVLILSLLLFLLINWLSALNKNDDSFDKKNDKPSNLLVASAPSFKVLTPDGISVSKLVGRVNPPNKSPVFVYIDRISKIKIRVSEQPLPDDFKKDTARKVSELAQSDNADAKINLGNDIVYIKNSADGPQSVIFTKSSLLITITSDGRIQNDQWAKYISALK